MNKVCAIVISFNPDETIISNVAALIPQVDEVVVVDNGSDCYSQRYIKHLTRNFGIKVIYNQANLGIAAALNVGVNYAIQGKYDWVATFDQDSLAPGDFISSMLIAYESCDYKEDVALVSPTYQEQQTGLLLSFGNPGDQRFARIKMTMTSGNLVKTSVFSSVGEFDEGFFIDYVDIEFCLRCLKNHYKIIESSESTLLHSLGSTRLHYLFGRKLVVTNHSDIRRYYITRNKIFVYKRYFSEEPIWCVKDFLSSVKDIPKIVLFEEHSASKILHMARGLWHGLRGKEGMLGLPAKS